MFCHGSLHVQQLYPPLPLQQAVVEYQQKRHLYTSQSGKGNKININVPPNGSLYGLGLLVLLSQSFTILTHASMVDGGKVALNWSYASQCFLDI